jgi:transcriptional regulator with XRE-family HTH domain
MLSGSDIVNIGHKIAELRDLHKLTQKELADKLNLSQSAIAYYETNKKRPSIETLQLMAKIFNVNISYFLEEQSRTDNRNERTPSPSLDDELTQIMRDLGPDVTLQFYDLKGMSQEEKEQLKIFLQGLKARRKEQKKD